MPRIDLISAGSVAVAANGARIGKGGGYSDLEFALTSELDLIAAETVVVTTVHEAQVVDGNWSVEAHDVPLDWIFTPSRTIECERVNPRPRGVLWDRVTDSMRADIPLLGERSEPRC